MGEKWYHYIYKIVCHANGKLYYGVHSTVDLQDGYMGSGAELAKAKQLYGKEQFHKEILCWCDTREKALEVENLIVKRDDPNTYNRIRGGSGGLSSYSFTESASVPADEAETPTQSHVDPFLECFDGVQGVYSQTHLFDFIKRNPHWYDTFKNEKQFVEELKKKEAFFPERIKFVGRKNWQLL